MTDKQFVKMLTEAAELWTQGIGRDIEGMDDDTKRLYNSLYQASSPSGSQDARRAA